MRKTKTNRSRRLPLSGGERLFTHRLWGSNKGIGSNNCYAYAMGDFESYRGQKSSPGNRSSNNSLRRGSLKCKDLIKRVLADNPKKVYRVEASKRCRPEHYKVMLVTAPGRDFHWYRQHSQIEWKIKKGDTAASIARFLRMPVTRVRAAVTKHNGRDKKTGKLKPGKNIRIKTNGWSHKRGWATAPLLKDARGRYIKDPRAASRAYPGLNYSRYCGAFCVRNKGIRTGLNWPRRRRRFGLKNVF